MPQNEHLRPHSEKIQPDHQNRLRDWFQGSSKGRFSEDELKLHRSAALAYADPRRPSIRSLYQMLCAMLGHDGNLTGIALNCPSYEYFRRLVLTLPAEFVDHRRYGRGVGLWDIVHDAGQIIDDIATAGAPTAPQS
ncbi:hypothetical protein HFO42_07690 [Rhizobium leguminosarum]|uniref:Uncharacterized protein n=1 Tax=Rhizobium leguminosarum TaxID=384 RepID=A0AAJ1A6M8_RHILE|nr:hypothetical protein [Rhizobium leguminosarum]MBY5538284.1 hypothetical protein [Rhizobium leguminosarum]MBY5594318.1 hypothetical protein [Rhizobium leguminosarum]MBY5627995.1 hypothetical protein [Rhizobium leguminosarum]